MLNFPDVLNYTVNHGQSTPQTFYIPNILSPDNCSKRAAKLPTVEDFSYTGLVQDIMPQQEYQFNPALKKKTVFYF